MIRRPSIALLGQVPLVLMLGACAVPFMGSKGTSQPASPTQAELTAAALVVPPPASGPSSVEPAAGDPAAPADPVAAAPHVAETPVAVPATPPVIRSSSAVDMSKEYLIGPEDVLDVSIWKNCPELCRVVPVRPDGKVSLPLVNDVQAAGLTPMELRQHLTAQLAEYLPTPEVSVIVREVHNFKVAVVGSVKMPGDYEIKSQATVLELIARAQGLTEFANRDKIVVLRQSGTKTDRIQFNYRKVAEGHDQDNFYVRAGDVIVVP
jgi:polysaccharide export outer membrane protein